MLYYFDDGKLEYRFARKTVLALGIFVSLLIISLVIMITSFSSSDSNPKKNHNSIDLSTLEPEERIIMLNNLDEFSEEKLKDYLLELNVKFPDIAFAQARYESGNWGTNPGAELFEANNNLFGMRIATARTATNQGAQGGYAYYSNWRMSAIDYAMWQNAVAGNLNTREEYIEYLKQKYAEGSYASIMDILGEVQKKYPELYVKKYPRLEK